MKYIKLYEASRILSKNFEVVGSALCVQVSKNCKVFTEGKKYYLYSRNLLPEKNFFKIYNDLGNYLNIYQSYNPVLNGVFYSESNTATFSTLDDTIEDYYDRMRFENDTKRYNL